MEIETLERDESGSSEICIHAASEDDVELLDNLCRFRTVFCYRDRFYDGHPGIWVEDNIYGFRSYWFKQFTWKEPQPDPLQTLQHELQSQDWRQTADSIRLLGKATCALLGELQALKTATKSELK